jgi:uncharacterized protein YndB with AHSA1/START domain
VNNTALNALNARHGTLLDPETLRIQRRLPGSIDRVWSYLTEPDLRRQWLAGGTTALQPHADFELVWRNDELSASSAERPEGMPVEHRATCRVLEVDAPRYLRYAWPDAGEVTIELEQDGAETLLTLTHRLLERPALRLNVAAGWHAHLARLVALVGGDAPPSLWATWKTHRAEYEELLCVR